MRKPQSRRQQALASGSGDVRQQEGANTRRGFDCRRGGGPIADGAWSSKLALSMSGKEIPTRGPSAEQGKGGKCFHDARERGRFNIRFFPKSPGGFCQYEKSMLIGGGGRSSQSGGNKLLVGSIKGLP